MKKPILGILGVCLMQIAFVAYTAFDRPFDASAVTAVREYALPPAPIEVVNDTIVVHRTSSNGTALKPLKPTPAIASTTARTNPKPSFQPKSVRPAQVFAQTGPKARTEYPIVPIDYAQTDLAYSGKVAATKKRSFFSKAFSVVKKPYTWTRSAFDKLH